MRKTGRPKKPPGTTKAEYLEIRCESAEKESFRACAEAAGLPLSGWIRSTLRKAAKRELESINQPVAFLGRLTA